MEYRHLARKHCACGNPFEDELEHEIARLFVSRDTRIAELEAALRALHRECAEAGHDHDKDFLWPIVMRQAAAALAKST